jgi:ribosome maturation factor RimP
MVEASDESVVIEVDGESYELPYNDMESARLEPVF